MNAVEFQTKYGKCIKDFFGKCLEYEQMPLQKMQDITMCCTDYGFDLRLETEDNSFAQEFEVIDKEIIPSYFETY